MKSKTTAILLCFFLGALGIHRFYLGHTLIGVIQLLTIGGFGFWALVDFVRLITGSLPVNSVEADTPKDDSTEEKQTVVQEKVAEYTESQKTEEAKKDDEILDFTIDKVPSEGEQSEAFTKIMKEMASAFEYKKESGKAHDLFVSPDIDQKKWQNFKIAAIKEFSDALDSPVSFFLNEPLVLIDTTVWGSGKKGIAVYVEFIVVMGVEAESRIYAFEDINSIAVIDEGREFVIGGGSKTNTGEDRNDEVKYVHNSYMRDTGINTFEKLLLYLNPSIKIEKYAERKAREAREKAAEAAAEAERKAREAREKRLEELRKKGKECRDSGKPFCAWCLCPVDSLEFVKGEPGEYFWKYRNKDSSKDMRAKSNYQSAGYISGWLCKECGAKTIVSHFVSVSPSKDEPAFRVILDSNGSGERIAEDWTSDEGITIDKNSAHHKADE